MESMKALGQRVRNARIKQRFSVVAAADASGIARDTWKKIEAGASVQDTKRQAALDLLGLDDNGFPHSVGGESEADRQYVSSSVGERVEGGKQDDEVLRAITSMSAALDQLVAGQHDLAERVDAGQRSLAERVDAVAAGSDDRFAALEAGLRELSERVEHLEEPSP